MTKIWAFEFFLAADGLAGKDLVDYFNFHIDLWVESEAQGYDGLLLSEHHFGGGYSPSPNLLIPMIAQRTKTMRLGVMGMVVPYHNPWRLAEEVGMLDVITNGRMEIGTSAGIPFELAKVGLTPQEARARYEEALEILDGAMKRPVISHSGKYWNFEEMPIVPRPIQADPPRWTTVVSVESARKAARRGSKIATGFIPTEKVKEVFDAYNEEAEKAGNPSGPDRLGLRRQVMLDLGDAGASEHHAQFSQGFRQMLESSDVRVIPSSGGKALDTPSGTHGYSLGDEEFVSGSSSEVAEQIIQQCRDTGAGHFQVVFAGYQSLGELARVREAFGREVIPLVKQG